MDQEIAKNRNRRGGFVVSLVWRNRPKYADEELRNASEPQ